MRLGLIAERFIDKDLDFNFAQMTRWLRKSKGEAYDLLCFGESSAQGFDGLSWNYEEDLKIALSKDDQRIWPLYINYNPKEWEEQEKSAYAERVSLLKRPVLMINSLSAPPNQAFGGAYLFDEGEIKAELAMGESGILTIEF